MCTSSFAGMKLVVGFWAWICLLHIRVFSCAQMIALLYEQVQPDLFVISCFVSSDTRNRLRRFTASPEASAVSGVLLQIVLIAVSVLQNARQTGSC